MCLDVTHIETLPDYHLLLTFENGERRLFDMQPLLSKRPWNSLTDIKKFAKAKVAYGTVMWPDNIDVAPETLYDESLPNADPFYSVHNQAALEKSLAQLQAGQVVTKTLDELESMAR